MIITEKDSGASISFHRKNLHKLFLDLKWTKPYGSILWNHIQEELSQENIQEGVPKYCTAQSLLLFEAHRNTELCGMAHALLCQSCHNKIPRTGWLKQ